MFFVCFSVKKLSKLAKLKKTIKAFSWICRISILMLPYYLHLLSSPYRRDSSPYIWQFDPGQLQSAICRPLQSPGSKIANGKSSCEHQTYAPCDGKATPFLFFQDRESTYITHLI